jgi:glycosyltransferase involved in cell wall biosynthesis
MKVLVITNLFPNRKQPNQGTFNRQKVSELAKICDLKVVAPLSWFPGLKRRSSSGIKESELIDNVEVFHPRYLSIPGSFRFLYGYLFYWSLKSVVKRIYHDFPFDLIYVLWAYPDGFGTYLIGRLLDKPVFIECLGSDINVFTRSFLRRFLICRALKGCSRVITVSQDLKNKLVRLGVPGKKVTVVINGVDTGLFHPTEKRSSRDKLNLGLEEKIVLFCGNLVEIKGVEYLVEAFSTIAQTEPLAHLYLVGEGYLKEKLVSLAQKSFASEKIHFMGRVEHRQIAMWMNCCDVFCLPSLDEGCPNVVIEALACGKPVVASRVGGIPELIDSEDYGILVEPEDSRQLASALAVSLNKNWNGEIIAAKYRNRSWAQSAKEVFDLFKDIK